MKLLSGIPSVSDYLKVLNNNSFIQIESFSNDFLRTNEEILKNYHLIKDPLHTIFRQWEYPFCYSRIEEYVKNIDRDSVNILDAGSGCAFFPYYLRHKFPNAMVCCCDLDARLDSFFSNINKNTQTNIDFKVYDLRKLGYRDNLFDVVYCISVLEHTTNYEEIIKEFKRVLKPDGLLIITFDISLDNKKSIPIEVAQDLLQQLNSEFRTTCSHEKDLELPELLREQEILTTDFGRKFNKKLLPWKIGWKQVIHEIMRLKIPKKPFYSLTVFCGSWRNRK